MTEHTPHESHRRDRQALKVLLTNSLLIAMVALVTIFVRIPTLLTRGYINLGDIVIIAAGFLLGGPRGALIGGMGSALADFTGGYMVFVPGTLIIKGLEGYLAGFIGHTINKEKKVLLRLAGGCAGAVFMVGGYFGYEMLIFGLPAALTALIPNLMQGITGVVCALAIYPVLAARIT
jgi:uncharacterized membrane protein